MLHWSSSRPAQFSGWPEAATRTDDVSIAERFVSRVVTHLGETLRHFQHQASLRAAAFGWEAPPTPAEAPWIPCPQCHRASMDRVDIPVPHDVFECPSCHTVVTDARGVTLTKDVPLPLIAEATTHQYEAWLIDDPRR